MNTYLLSYTIHNKDFEYKKVRREFKEFIEEFNNRQLFETTYLIKIRENDVSCDDLCLIFKEKFDELITEHNAKGKISLRLGVFDIYDYCYKLCDYE